MANREFDKVGVIGLGIIGRGIAGALRKTDCEVYVWNRSPKTEPNFLGSPAELASIANLIQIFVTDGKALLAVMDRLKDSLTPAHVVMNHSTVEPKAVVQAHQIARAAGADFLDAPFTGSKDAAAAGLLVYYIGGDADVLERVKPTLQLSAKEIIPVGQVGQASIIKIATNMISASTVAVLSEAYGLTKAANIDPKILEQAIENNACSSALTSMKMPTIIEGNYETHFSLKNMFKDSKFALDLAKQYDTELPVLTTTANVMYRSMSKGHGESDYSAIATNYQTEEANS